MIILMIYFSSGWQLKLKLNCKSSIATYIPCSFLYDEYKLIFLYLYDDDDDEPELLVIKEEQPTLLVLQ